MKNQRHRSRRFGRGYRFVFSLALLSQAGAGTQGDYDLGTLPLQPLAINASGRVTGSASFDGSTMHAALYTAGQLVDLGTLGGDLSHGVAMNASGSVVGDSTLPNGLTHAVLWSNGQIIDLGTLPGGSTSYATGINDAGEITGWSDTLQPGTTSPRPEHAFLYANGQMTDLGSLSATGQFGNSSQGAAINHAGEVTGWSVTDDLATHAFLYSGGQMIDLGTLGGSESRGTALNDAGEIVGWSFLPNDAAAHAFLVRDGLMLDLGTLAGQTNSYALAINATGTIVGNSSSSSGGPFVFSGGTGLVNLNSYIDTFLQILTRAISLNDAGQILAHGITDNFIENEYLLTPILHARQLGNFSTRLQVGTDDDVLIAGFIIQGPAGFEKNVLLRGIGPSLAELGVGHPLANPTLELRGTGGVLLATNDDWKATQEAEITATQLAPGSELESALVASLAPGAYTAIVRGANGASGVALAEVYDLDGTSAVRTTNVSTRGLVGREEDLLIGGLIINGADPVEIMARAIGPSLGALGLPNALADPILELHDAEGNVTSNDDWRETQEEEILAAQLAPNDERESAILTTLAPGAYTAILRGKADSTGVALIEFYRL